MIGQEIDRPSAAGPEADFPFAETAIEEVFQSYADPVRQALLELRGLILRTALDTVGVGPVHETLKWGQPSYLPTRPKIGTTLRIDAVRSGNSDFALYFHCRTTLATDFRARYPDEFVFEGSRALLFSCRDALPRDALQHCVALALTYHLQLKSF